MNKTLHMNYMSIKRKDKQKTKIKTKKKNLIKKWAEELNRHFSKEDADGQQAHENILNDANHHGNTNQNHNEISLHTCQNG